MKSVIAIEYIRKWSSTDEIVEFCKHIISHSERYEKERVFEAKSVLNKYFGEK